MFKSYMFYQEVVEDQSYICTNQQ